MATDQAPSQEVTSMALEVRLPVPADAEQVARLIHLGDPEKWDSAYTSDRVTAQGFLALGVRRGKGLWGSPSALTVAAEAEAIVAVMVAFAAENAWRLWREQLWQTVRAYGLLGSLRVSIRRRKHMMSITGRPTKNRSFVVYVRVAEEHRHRETIKPLLEYVKESARADGSRFLVTHVRSEDGAGLEKLNELGFQETAEVLSRDTLLRRMTLVL
jgi:hypothetical protein